MVASVHQGQKQTRRQTGRRVSSSSSSSQHHGGSSCYRFSPHNIRMAFIVIVMVSLMGIFRSTKEILIHRQVTDLQQGLDHFNIILPATSTPEISANNDNYNTKTERVVGDDLQHGSSDLNATLPTISTPAIPANNDNYNIATKVIVGDDLQHGLNQLKKTLPTSSTPAILANNDNYDKTEVAVVACGGTVKQQNVNANQFFSIHTANSCNEAYTMTPDWVIEIHDDRAGPIDFIDHLEDGYCKKSELESWGVVAYKETKKNVNCDFDITTPLDITCNSYRPPEYHTFVLWNPSLWKLQEKFLQESSLVEVVDTFIVTENHKEWCVNIYGGIKRFVAKKKNCHPYGDPKVVVVLDRNPIYGQRNTAGSRQVLNREIYGLKEKMRKIKKGGHMAVHSSNNVEEAHLVLDPLNRTYGPPLTEFDSLKDMFNILDTYKCFQYVVLRSHEEVNDGSVSTNVDILVNDFFMFKAITGAQSQHKAKMRELDNGPNIQNMLSDKWKFNVRYVGDGYYDTAWQLRMLQLRVRSRPGGVWIQEPVSYAMSLLYHSNVHKSPNATTSSSHWNVIHQTLPLLTDGRSWRSRTALQTYMTAHGYNVSKPHDSEIHHYKFEAFQTAKLVYHAENVKNYKRIKTPIGDAVVKTEASAWTRTCGKKEFFPRYCDRPYGEYIFSEASNYVNVSGVPLSVARKFSFGAGAEEEEKLRSIQNMVQMKKFDVFKKDPLIRVGAGILDYLLDNCDRFGKYPKWKMKFILPKKYNKQNWQKDPSGIPVLFDNGKSMSCHGTKSLQAARDSVSSFWEGWCNFPSTFHVAGISSFLFDHMGLPNSYIDEEAMRGLQWREQALLEYMGLCQTQPTQTVV